MPNLYVARRPKRRGLLLPMLGNRASPSLLFPLDKIDRSELDDLVRAILAKQGVTKETEIQAIVDKAEQDSEVRIKIHEARQEVRRLMAEKKKGNSLISVGFRKWRVAFYPAVKRFREMIGGK